MRVGLERARCLTGAMPTAAVNGIELYYELDGTGPRLLFVNGSGATLESSRPLVAPFRDHFEVLAHDQRGLGRSTVAPGPCSMADYAADAVALVDHVGWGSCRVVGVSFGGMVAQELAVTWPERVERLALLCTSPGGPGGSSYPLHELAALDASERAARMVTLLDTRFTPEWLDTHADDRALVAFFASRLVGEASAGTAEQLRGEAAQLEARRHHDVTDRLGAIRCPTLVASGRFDGIAPPANGEIIAARVPDSELRLYEGGHAFFVQDRTALPEVLAFLG